MESHMPRRWSFSSLIILYFRSLSTENNVSHDSWEYKVINFCACRWDLLDLSWKGGKQEYVVLVSEILGQNLQVHRNLFLDENLTFVWIHGGVGFSRVPRQFEREFIEASSCRVYGTCGNTVIFLFAKQTL